MDHYHLRDGYICNLGLDGKAIPFLDDEHGSTLYQYKVYQYARKIIKSRNFCRLLDVGCGYGIKLKEIIHPVCQNIVGIDGNYAIKFCSNSYSFGDWYHDDIENPTLKLDRKFDLIISSDVIEHMVDPDKLLEYIKKYSHKATQIIVSTPERDRISNQNPQGPPRNLSHVREWNMAELHSYFKSRGLRIIRHFLLGEKVLSYRTLIMKILRLEPIRRIQVVHCLKSN